MDANGLSLKQQVLLAGAQVSNGDCGKSFTMEDLLVRAWLNNRRAWGLRGHEDDHPDSDKIQKEIGSRGGDQKSMVQLGWFERLGPRIYRITATGLAAAAALDPSEALLEEKASRTLEAEVTRILEHPVFKDWLRDPERPKRFREAGHFWGVAPGTPSKVVAERVCAVERTLDAALDLMDRRGVDEVVSQRGKVLFDRNDIERAVQFQRALRQRFARDLGVLTRQPQLQ